jgi:hypothetical protein
MLSIVKLATIASSESRCNGTEGLVHLGKICLAQIVVRYRITIRSKRISPYLTSLALYPS